MFNWLSNLFSPQRDELRPRKPPHVQAVAVHNSLSTGDPMLAGNYHNIYQHSPWVYVSVSRIAEAGALVPLKVYRMEGDQRLEVENHPLETLLDRPNPHLSRFELFEQTLGALELTGNAYWYLAGDAVGRPSQIWPLRPDRVRIVPDAERYIGGYLYEVDGLRIPFEAVEVVHFKRWHPANDYYGLSALEAARMAVETDRAMARWNQNTFGSENGVPAGIVNITDFVSDSDFERIKREWRSSYGSAQRKTAFLRGGTVQWQNIGLSHTDLDFLKGRLSHRDEILNIFGIPVGLVSENATEANAIVAERQFVERTLWPKLVRMAQKITQEMLPFYPGTHIAAFEDIRPTDVQVRLDEIRAAQTVLSINEIRQRYYDLPPAPWGEMPVGFGEMSVGALHESPDEEEHNAAEPPTKSIVEELAQWERFALNRLGKSETRPFQVEAVPDVLAFEISANLLAADDKDAVKAVFAAVRAALEAEDAHDS